MFEQELVDLTGYLEGGGKALDVRRGQGWALITAIWGTRSNRLLGCLPMQTSGNSTADAICGLESEPAAA